MLQVNYIRQNREYVLERLAVKHFNGETLVDTILELDDRRKKLTFQYDDTQAKVKAASKEIGQLLAKKHALSFEEHGLTEERKKDVAALNAQLKPIEESLAATETELLAAVVQLPNLPNPSVPYGKTPEENVIVREGGMIPQLGPDARPHWDLAKQYDLIDFELGTKITGSGFPVYKGKGARLQRALIQFSLDFNTEAGYTEYEPPFIVNEASAFGTTQLPDKEGQMYVVTEERFYLIPTAEVPLTNIYRDVLVKEQDLPIKMTAYTPCFRREAGSYGKDVRGLNRVHQFDKVEMVQLVHPGKSYDVLEEMVAHVERMLQSLQLPYRILRLCGGEMGFSSALQYDFEVYSAAQGKWLEVSSVSNFETFQTTRLKARFKDAGGKTQLLHSLNGSAVALPRIVACLLENNQTREGIVIPEALRHYFGATSIS